MKQREFRTGVAEDGDGVKSTKRRDRQINIGLITGVEKREMGEARF
jgi:hypothetical protein